MAIGAGMTSAIMNPLHEDVQNAVRAADVLTGNDRECGSWIAKHRGPGAEATGRRRGGRRRAVAS